LSYKLTTIRHSRCLTQENRENSLSLLFFFGGYAFTVPAIS
jgi:hypothetical protein